MSLKLFRVDYTLFSPDPEAPSVEGSQNVLVGVDAMLAIKEVRQDISQTFPGWEFSLRSITFLGDADIISMEALVAHGVGSAIASYMSMVELSDQTPDAVSIQDNGEPGFLGIDLEQNDEHSAEHPGDSEPSQQAVVG